MTKKIETMNFQGRAYAQVKDRVAAFHESNQTGSIRILPTVSGDTVFFVATVVPDSDKPERFFTGSSFAKLSKEKSWEKGETVAVGRALAFMGLGADGSIASYDEVEDMIEQEAPKQAATARTEAKKPIVAKVPPMESARKAMSEAQDRESLEKLLERFAASTAFTSEEKEILKGEAQVKFGEFEFDASQK